MDPEEAPSPLDHGPRAFSAFSIPQVHAQVLTCSSPGCGRVCCQVSAAIIIKQQSQSRPLTLWPKAALRPTIQASYVVVGDQVPGTPTDINNNNNKLSDVRM